MHQLDLHRKIKVPIPNSLAFWLTFLGSMCYMATITVLHSEATSPIDEWVYLDYLEKVSSHGGYVRFGEHISLWTQQLLACHGASPFGPIGEYCSLPKIETFPNQGLTTGGGYYPSFFWTINILSWPLQSVGISQIMSWRLVGLFFLAISLITLWKLLGFFEVQTAIKVILTLTFVIAPISWWSFSYVSTDAPVIAIGFITLAVTAQVLRGKASGAWFIPIAFFAGQIKPPALLPLASAGIWILVDSISRPKDSKKLKKRFSHIKSLGWLALSLLLGAFEIIFWSYFQNLAQASPLRAEQNINRPLDIIELLQQFGNFLTGVLNAGGVNSYLPSITFSPFTWISLAFVIGAAFVTSPKNPLFPVVITASISLLAFSCILAIALQVYANAYFQIPARYGAGIIGLILLSGISVLKERWAIVVWLTYLGIAAVTEIWMSLFFSQLAP